MSTGTQGLLFVLSQSEPDLPTEKFNDWYDNEHAPARRTVPGIHTAIRYQAVDEEKPDWLALYDMDKPEVLQSPEYVALRDAASNNEKDLMPRLPVLQRRIYSRIAESVGKPDALPGKYILVVIWDVQEEVEVEFNKWYDEEHTAEVAKTPGWLRGRRYKLVEGVNLVPREGPAFGNYVVIHDFDNGDYMETLEFQSSIQTPWAKKMLGGAIKGFAIRRFKLYRAF